MGTMKFWGMSALFLAVQLRAESSVSLSEVLAKAQAHPKLKAARAQFEAAREKERATGLLADPVVGLSWMGQDGPFKNMQGERSKFSWSISQALPFPLTWWKMQKALSSSSQAAELKSQWMKSELDYQAKMAFWNYVHAYQAKLLLEEEQALIEKHKKDTTYRPVRHELMTAHLFEVDEDLSLGQSALSQAQAHKEATYFNLLELTGAEKQTALPTPSFSTELSDSDKQEKKQLNKDLRIAGLHAETLAQKAQVARARSEYAPNINMTYKSYSEDAPMPNAKEFMLGLSIPFAYFWQRNAKIDQERATLRVLEAQEQSALRALNAQWEGSQSQLKSLRENLLRLRQKIIPLSQKRYRYLSRLSASDMETLMQRYASAKKLVAYKKRELDLFVELKIKEAWLHTFEESSL